MKKRIRTRREDGEKPNKRIYIFCAPPPSPSPSPPGTAKSRLLHFNVIPSAFARRRYRKFRIFTENYVVTFLRYDFFFFFFHLPGNIVSIRRSEKKKKEKHPANKRHPITG